MSIEIASAIVSHLGPCRLRLDARTHAMLAVELGLLGCDVRGEGADAAVIEWNQDESVATLAAGLPDASIDTLALISMGGDRATAEAALFGAGWERHPGAVSPGELTTGPTLAGLSFYRRGTGGLLGAADDAGVARIGRWATVAQHVRPGDTVLLRGDGASEAVEIVAALSRASRVLVAPEAIDTLDLRGFDLIAALGAQGAWDVDLLCYARLLRLDGRLIVGWPEGDRQAPPGWAALSEALCEEFLIESRWVQQPGMVAPSRMAPQEGLFGGWLIAAASANPIGGEAERDTFVHPAFGHVDTALVDFTNGYDNPWLYRPMVQMGERLGVDDLLSRLAEYVIGNARAGSADQGAAIAVLGYRVLEKRAVQHVPLLLGIIANYCDQADDAPHAVRWALSLAYLAGRLAELAQDRVAALDWYARAAGGDWHAFSPILATKVVGAAFFAARLMLAEGDEAAARGWFGKGLDTALAAAAADHRAELGDPDRPLAFYMTELAEVIDMGSQCANALANLHLWRRDPGLFWRQVDVKRFGLASWALDLRRENAQMREMLARVQAARRAS